VMEFDPAMCTLWGYESKEVVDVVWRGSGWGTSDVINPRQEAMKSLENSRCCVGSDFEEVANGLVDQVVW
jgi:hypothetical protein